MRRARRRAVRWRVICTDACAWTASWRLDCAGMVSLALWLCGAMGCAAELPSGCAELTESCDQGWVAKRCPAACTRAQTGSIGKATGTTPGGSHGARFGTPRTECGLLGLHPFEMGIVLVIGRLNSWPAAQWPECRHSPINPFDKRCVILMELFKAITI